MKQPYWALKSPEKRVGALYLYEEIGSPGCGAVGVADFKRELDALGTLDLLQLYINSPGGDIFEGLAIYNLLRRVTCKKIAFVDGIAASIATLPLLAADERCVPENAMLMIHNGWTKVRGDAAGLRKTADELDKATDAMKAVYLERTTLNAETLTAMMDAETWLTAHDCKAHGFAHTLLPAKQFAACISKEAGYTHAPAHLLAGNQTQMDESTCSLIQDAHGLANHYK